MTDAGRNMTDDLYEQEELDYSVEMNPIPLKDSPPLDLYNFIAEIARYAPATPQNNYHWCFCAG